MSGHDDTTGQVPTEANAITLARHPGERADRHDFTLVRRPVRRPRAGEVVVHNLVTSVDPYQLGMLRTSRQPGDIVDAGCVGVVVESRDPQAPVGTQVATYSGWLEYVTWTLADTELAPRELGDELDWIHVLGTPGVTAYVGMHDVAGVQPGWTVAVTGAAGAVGGVAVQVAKAAGARVIAIAGGSRRVEHTVQRLGADVGLDYRSDNFTEQFRDAAAGGLDLFFDNVGGPTLDTAVSLLSDRGQAVVSGTVSTFEARPEVSFGPEDSNFVRGKIRSFHVADYYATRLAAVRTELARMLRSGEVTTIVSEFQGLESAPLAFETVFTSGSSYVGKRAVRIATATARTTGAEGVTAS